MKCKNVCVSMYPEILALFEFGFMVEVRRIFRLE